MDTIVIVWASQRWFLKPSSCCLQLRRDAHEDITAVAIPVLHSFHFMYILPALPPSMTASPCLEMFLSYVAPHDVSLSYIFPTISSLSYVARTMSLSYLAPTILESFTCRILSRPLISLLASSVLAIAILLNTSIPVSLRLSRCI
jgi:hypothetical protein